MAAPTPVKMVGHGGAGKQHEPVTLAFEMHFSLILTFGFIHVYRKKAWFSTMAQVSDFVQCGGEYVVHYGWRPLWTYHILARYFSGVEHCRPQGSTDVAD